MRKSLVAILAVAIIGCLGIYGKSHPKTVQSSSNSNSITPSTSSSNNSTPAVESTDTATPTPSISGYKDGSFTGTTKQTAYGPVQIAVVISGGRITNISFLQMPNDRGHTQEVTAQSSPILKQETLSAQSANIDFVSGATDTSFGYQKSLQAALDQAKVS